MRPPLRHGLEFVRFPAPPRRAAIGPTSVRMALGSEGSFQMPPYSGLSRGAHHALVPATTPAKG